MRIGKERPKLFLSVGLVALTVAAPVGAWAMNLGSSRPRPGTVVHVNSVPLQRSNPGGGSGSGNVGAGGGRNIGIIGSINNSNGSGRGVNPCGTRRGYLTSCGPVQGSNGGNAPGTVVVNNGGSGPHYPPIGMHPPHWYPPVWLPPSPAVGSIAPTTPTVLSPSPSLTGAAQNSGGASPQALRRNGSGVPPANERRYVPDEVVVELAGSAITQQTDALGRRYRLARLQSVPLQLDGTTLVRWRITDRRSVPAVIRTLETDTSVLSAQPNYLFALQDGTVAPSEGDPAQYMLEKMHLPQAHEIARGNRVLVAVIDSGIDITHPDLVGDIAGTFDALGTGLKPHTHGTAIAGAIAAHGRLMGAAPSAQILAVCAFSGGAADDGTTFAIRSGLSWAVTHGARVVNMSFAGPQDPGIARSIADAHDKGVALIAAAGNKGAQSPPLYPAADPNVIAVTSTDTNDQLPAFANRGRYVAVAAPGVDLMLLAPNGSLQVASGTSFSAAYVTGTAALMLERKPDLAPETLRQALALTAHHLATRPIDKENQAGAGLVDAYQAVLSLTPASFDAAAGAQVPTTRQD